MGAKHLPPITVPTEGTVLGYLAGLIDADGNISICKSNGAKGQKNATYSVMVQFTNTDFAIMQWLLEVIGGAVHSRKRTNPKHKEAFVWKVYGTNAQKLLLALEPHLRIKRDRCSVALRFRELGMGSGLPSQEREKLADDREILRVMLVALNERGVSTGP